MDKLLEILKNAMQLIFPPFGINAGIDMINKIFVIIMAVVVIIMPFVLFSVLIFKIIRGKKHE